MRAFFGPLAFWLQKTGVLCFLGQQFLVDQAVTLYLWVAFLGVFSEIFPNLKKPSPNNKSACYFGPHLGY